jgi:diguanylate cyclase (GGDEF)-like protein
MRRKSALTHSGDVSKSPSPRRPSRRGSGRAVGRVAQLLQGGGTPAPARVILLAALLAVVPVVLATVAFGQLFRTSESDRVDARLAVASRLAVDRITSAETAATAAARSVAVDRRVQLALARRDAEALRQMGYRKGGLTVTVSSRGSTAPAAAADGITRTVLVGTLGRVDATVRVAPALAGLGRRTNTQLSLVPRGEGRSAPGPAGQPYDVSVRGEEWRALREPVAAGRDLVAAVPASAIGSTVHRRQLATLAAAGLTIAAIALIAFLLVQRLRGADPLARARRSPVALFGDVVAAAHDPTALLPVILETAVAATDASGGRVVWDATEIASIGGRVGTGGRLAFPLDEEDRSLRQIVLYAPQGGFTAAQREVAEALVAQGRIALENARLHTLVRRQAVTDELTDLANRRRFMEVLQQEVARASRFGTSLALLLFDLDNFKQINDRCGHQTGDEVLRAVAAMLRARVRETDLPARFGGEEFAVVLAGTDLDGARAVAEKLRHDLSQEVLVPLPDWPVTASFGVAVLHPGESAELLIGAADRALYRAKAEGRNRVCAADSEPSAAA